MSPDPQTRPNTAVILERLESLRCDVSEVKGIVSAHMADERKAREDYLVEHAAVVQKADAAHRRLDVLEPTVIKLQETMQELQRAMIKNTEAQAAQTQRLNMIFGAVAFIATLIGGWVLNQLLGLIR